MNIHLKKSCYCEHKKTREIDISLILSVQLIELNSGIPQEATVHRKFHQGIHP